MEEFRRFNETVGNELVKADGMKIWLGIWGEISRFFEGDRSDETITR